MAVSLAADVSSPRLPCVVVPWGDAVLAQLGLSGGVHAGDLSLRGSVSTSPTHADQEEDSGEDLQARQGAQHEALAPRGGPATRPVLARPLPCAQPCSAPESAAASPRSAAAPPLDAGAVWCNAELEEEPSGAPAAAGAGGDWAEWRSPRSPRSPLRHGRPSAPRAAGAPPQQDAASRLQRLRWARACPLQRLCQSRELGFMVLGCLGRGGGGGRGAAGAGGAAGGLRKRGLWRGLRGLRARPRAGAAARAAARGGPRSSRLRLSWRRAPGREGAPQGPGEAPGGPGAGAPGPRRPERPAHSPLALRAWGSLLLAYWRDGVSLHRRHFLSQASLRGGLLHSGGAGGGGGGGGRRVCAAKGAPAAAAAAAAAAAGPPQRPEELSLAGRADHAVYEYVEESPLLLGGVGMAHRVFTYFRPPSAHGAYSGPRLGPFGGARPVRLLGSQALPGLLLQQVRLRPGKGLAVMESSLVRAPLFRHEPKAETDFLLLRSACGHQERLLVRRIQCTCLVGQTEPLVEVCAPSSRQSAMRRRRCVRRMVQEAWRRGLQSGETAQSLEERAAEDVQKWWAAREAPVIRSECKDSETPEEQDSGGSASFPEDVCVLEAMERGIRRLHVMGIRGLSTFDRTLKKAVEELVFLESRRADLRNPFARRARWVMEQLQLTPWHLVHQYAAVRDGTRPLFAVSGPGDPSGGRGEGVSFLNIWVGGIPESLEVAGLQRLSGSDLRQELARRGLGKQEIRHLTRAEQLALLREFHRQDAAASGGAQRPASDRLNLSAKRSYDRLLQEAFDRQLDALGSQSPVISEDSGMEDGSAGAVTATEAHSASAARVLPAAASGGASASPGVAGAGATAAAEGLLDDLESEPEDQAVRHGSGRGPPNVDEEEEDADATEMARLRAALVESAPSLPSSTATRTMPPVESAPAAVAPSERRRIQMLKVITVEKSPLGQLNQRALFVFGADNIRRFREQQHQAAQVAADVAAWRHSGRGSASASGVGAGEGSESPRSSARGVHRPASPRRAGSDAVEQRGPATKKLRIVGS